MTASYTRGSVQDTPDASTQSAVTEVMDFLSRSLLLDSLSWSKIGLTIIALFSVWLLRRLLRRVIQGIVEDRALQYRWGKANTYVTSVLATLVIASIWVEGLRQVGTFLGLFTAGMAIALKDVIVDFAGWLVIVTKSPLQIGDRIQIGEHAGDVVDISVLHFTLLEIGNWVAGDQSTGRVIRVPNAKVLTESVANYTAEFPYLWNEIPVVITFESNWRKAKEMFLAIVQEKTEQNSQRVRDFLRRNPSRMLISYDVVTATVYTSVSDHGICLTLRFLTESRKRRVVQEALWEAVLSVVEGEPDIDLAYPTTRIVNLEQVSVSPLLPDPDF